MCKKRNQTGKAKTAHIEMLDLFCVWETLMCVGGIKILDVSVKQAV